ncbi:kinesin-like protein KIFC3 isoform X2 [Lepisosteus oculatus]|uniref:kinesin-like protein KIFC3 isoform X2 n=1 Tax=Lepisosteus oculatus TaxID=7918 RepID=UPI0035F5072A
MYVLCTLVVLSLHSLFKGRKRGSEVEKVKHSDRERNSPRDCCTDNHSPGYEAQSLCTKSNRTTLSNMPGCCYSTWAQPAHWPSAALSPTVMFSTRKTWDLGHAHTLQELWKKDLSLDESAVDFLMSDGEEGSAFIPLQSSVFPCQSMTSDQPEPSAPHNQQLLVQVRLAPSCNTTAADCKALQEKVCEFQARLLSEEAGRKLQLQRLRQSHEQHVREKLALIRSLQDVVREQEAQLRKGEAVGSRRSSLGSRPVPSVQRLAESLSSAQEEKSRLQEELLLAQDRLRCRDSEQQATISRLRAQVEDLKEKLLLQAQEVNRLRSELGATDLEKQLEILVSENERLKQELTQAEGQGACPARADCRHSQDAEALRCRLVQREAELREEAGRAAELEGQLEEVRREAGELEGRLGQRLRDCQQALARQAAQAPHVKYVTRTVEVESAQSKQALSEAQTRNKVLEEQLASQRQHLRELEGQLHDSQRTCSQLRAQIQMYEGEMERAQGQLEAEMQSLEEEKNRVIEEAFIRAESEMKAVHENLAGVRMNLLTLQPALRTLTCDYNCLKKQVQDFPFMLETAISEAKQEICQVIGEVSSANQELLRKYKREMTLRKKCHNELVKLKGNIRVFCRVRPVCKEELDATEAKNIVTFDPDDDAVLHLSHKGKPVMFELDKVFPPQATQEEVFHEVQALITSCIDGYNVCIFAYGQTGSGKTYTMEGVPDNPGINQRALRLLFSEVAEKAPDWDFTITVSMVEIYNETLRNLLGDNPNEKLDIKMCPDGSGQLYVPGLTEFTVTSVEDINRVFELGHMNRATACTNLNEHSSRSHALLIISVTGVNSTTGHRTAGKLNLVDLAGSERIAKSGAEGSRLREAQCINKSLAALGDVIHALRSRHAHIPFRNSRLTYLLQDSLSGDSKTLMMVQVSPLDTNVSESLCSLKFGQRVRTVELASAARKQAENSSASSSPTHDSVELDSPPVTPVPIPSARASSLTTTPMPMARPSGSTRRKLQQPIPASSNI